MIPYSGSLCCRIQTIWGDIQNRVSCFEKPTDFVSLQHDLGQGPVIKCINIFSGKLMNIHGPQGK